MSPDPYKASAGRRDPGSWNRYSYVQGDPVNYGDPGGLNLVYMDQGNLGEQEFSSFDYLDLALVGGGDTGVAIDPGLLVLISVFGLQSPGTRGGQGNGGSGSVDGSCAQLFSFTFGLFSGGEQDAVSVLLGENSWNFMGTHQYQTGQAFGHGTGPIIGVSDVFSEDQYMSDVILNRVSQWGGTLSSQSSNTKQFNGYTAGAAMFNADLDMSAYTTQCSDLMVAFAALRSQETGSRLNTSILFWGAVVNPKTSTAISVPPGDFMVADTIFGAKQVY
jgi:hypothetical protein